MRKAIASMLLLAISVFAHGQGEWFLRYNPVREFLTPNDRSISGGMAFALDDLVYFGGGISAGEYMSILYTHNTVTAEKGSIPIPSYMAPFSNGIAFTVGGTAYFGLGHDDSWNAFDAIQSFSPGSGYAYPMLVFPGGARHNAVAFTVGGKAYIGGGQNGNWQTVNDLWEFDPLGPTWTAKASLPVATETGAVTFDLGGIGYVLPDGSNQLRAYDPVTNNWSLRAPFPGGARSAAVGFVYEGKGYVGTGRLSGQRKSDFFIYDPSTDSWSTGPSIWDSYGRDDAAAVSHNGRAYVLGGNSMQQSGTGSAEVWELGPPQPLVPGTWVQRPFLPGPPRTNPVAFTIGSQAYVGGGSNVNATWAQQFFAYDPVMREWTARAPLPAPSTLGASVDGIGYILTAGASGNFWAYDPGQDSWSPRADMPAPRSSAVAFGLMGRFHIATGTIAGTRQKDLWAYDPQTDTWEQKAVMTGSAVQDAAAFALPDRACVMGGNISGGSTNTSQVRCYAPATNTWTSAPSLNPNGVTNHLMGFAVGNTGYRAGGIQSTNFILDALQSYDPMSNTWTAQAALGGGWRAQGAAFGLAGSGFVVAGRLSPNNNSVASSFYYNDMWEYITTESYAEQSPGGKIFVDEDEDCTWTAGEIGVPAQILSVQPGNYFTTTGPEGQFSVTLLPAGQYTIAPVNPYLTVPCGAAAQDFTMPVTGAPPVVDLPTQAEEVPDLLLSLNSGLARVGFAYSQSILLKNIGFASSGTIQLEVTTDQLINFQNASPAPTSNNAGMLTWQLPAMDGQEQLSITLNYAIPPNIQLMGHVITTAANATAPVTDADPSNNTVTHWRTITAAYDPNDKLATTSTGSASVWQLDEDEWIDYSIRFQNTGTDTAFKVFITDTLPAHLDPATLVVGAASHPFSWELRGHGILKFTFPNILLPDSNINEPLSHGFVGFRIRPRLPLLPGDEIINRANIHFDFNPPVITEPSVLSVVQPGVQLQVKAVLGGPFNGGTGLMSDALRTASLIPMGEPYTALGYAHSGGGGGENTSTSVLSATGPTAIVDWVVIEVRSAAIPSQVVQSRSALLRRDGRVVDGTGSTAIGLYVPAGNYHIAIRHRDHLGCMTLAPVALSTSTPLVDLSTPATATWGSDARKNVNGTMVLWPGDANFDGMVKYTGVGNDRDAALMRVGGSTPTNTMNGYHGEDVNMDGVVKYSGTANDRDIILQTIGGVIPTAIRTQQLP